MNSFIKIENASLQQLSEKSTGLSLVNEKETLEIQDKKSLNVDLIEIENIESINEFELKRQKKAAIYL